MADVDPHPGPLLTFFQGIVKSDSMCFFESKSARIPKSTIQVVKTFWLRGTHTPLKTNISPEN